MACCWLPRWSLAALAAVLLHVGYKLARIELLRHMLRQSLDQWLPFVVTVIAILFTDLLKGVGVGLVVGIFFILRTNLQHAFFIHDRSQESDADGDRIRLKLSENVSFLNRASVTRVLGELPDNSVVEVDGRQSNDIHPDALELIHEFAAAAHNRGIRVHLLGIPPAVVALGH